VVNLKKTIVHEKHEQHEQTQANNVISNITRQASYYPCTANVFFREFRVFR